MNTAAKVRAEKLKRPERFCVNEKCLWRVWTKAGLKPCPIHMEKKGPVSAGPGQQDAPE